MKQFYSLLLIILLSSCLQKNKGIQFNIPEGFMVYEPDSESSELLVIQYEQELGLRVLNSLEHIIKKSTLSGSEIFKFQLSLVLPRVMKTHNATNKSKLKTMKGKNHEFNYWEFDTLKGDIPTYLIYGGVYKKKTDEYFEIMIYGLKEKRKAHEKQIKFFLTSFD